MKRLWNGLFVSIVSLQLPLVACAGYGWGIYDPVTNQQVKKSNGNKTCSGIADVAGAISVNLRSPAGALQDSGNGTADGTIFHAWSAVLGNPNLWSIDTGTSRHTAQLLDSNGNIKHQTQPQIVP